MKNTFCLLVLMLAGLVLPINAETLSADSTSDDSAEKMAVVVVPHGVILASDGTRDDEVLYGLTVSAVDSGDIVLLDMPYGQVPTDSRNVKLVSKSEAETWKDSITHQVITPYADIQSEPKTQSFPPIITLPRGAYLKIGAVNSEDERYVEAELFGGVKGWIRRPLVRPIRNWDSFTEDQLRQNLVNDAMLYLGTSYRWGGRTPEGVDCSGLIHLAYNFNGLEVYRNSRPKYGFPIALKHVPGTTNNTHTLETLKDVKPGDTIHFSGHVGMYIGNGKFIHANGKDFSTTIASLISGDEGYREDIARPSEINTFGTAFPDEPEKLSVREFYALQFTSGDQTGYRFYVRADGYAPNKAVIYPEGLDSEKVIVISEDVPLWRFVYSGRDTDKAPAYFYTEPGRYRPAVRLINDEGYRPSGKTISSDIFVMPEEIIIEHEEANSASPDVVNAESEPAIVNAEHEPEIVNTESEAGIVNAENEPEIEDAPYKEAGFVKVSEYIPDAVLEIRYYSDYNFVGERIDGYEAPEALLTLQAAQALHRVSDELMSKGYRLKIYDAYRPQRAVNHFLKWSGNPKDTKMKKDFYPELSKNVLFKQGYIARKSGHSRGSTVDLTLFDAKTSRDADMGGTFDYFGARSHYNYKNLTRQQKANRKLLRDTMTKYGFRPIRTEWWHFTLNNEPYPGTYFDFEVK